MDQDLVLELLQLTSRVEAELVDQAVPGSLVRRQRIGLAAVAVQGDHRSAHTLASGCSLTSPSSSPITSLEARRSSRAASWSSTRPRRTSSRRAR